MSSVSAGLVAGLDGVQEPTARLVPDAAWCDADDAVFLASSYGLTPDPWQALVLQGWMGRRGDGKWAASRCGLAVPRQNGKNGILEIRELFGMVALGERILHTAHEVKTARKAFARLLGFFDNERDFPELKNLVAGEPRRANGQEAIYLTNGGSVEFIARSKGSGRGFTVDVIVMDEAQELSDDALAALMPTVSAAPLGNPQLIFTGTPPAPSMNGEVFTRTRQTGLKGQDGRLCWHDWACERGADLDAPENWAKANPALGGRVLYETIADERAQMGDDEYARERLGVWDDPLAQFAGIPIEAWLDRSGADGKPDGPVAFALSASWPRAETGSIAIVSRHGSEVWAQVVKHAPGTSWMPAEMRRLQDEHHPVAVVLDDKDPAACEKAALVKAGVELTSLSMTEVTQAYGMLVAAVMGDVPYLRHYDQPELNDAVASARKREVGDAHTWTRKGPDDISPVVAVTNALQGLASHKPMTPFALLG
jgi:hypothetical protein